MSLRSHARFARVELRYKKKKTMEKIIDSEGSEIKLLKLSTPDEN